MPLTTTGVLPKAAVMAPAKMYAPRKFRLGKKPFSHFASSTLSSYLPPELICPQHPHFS